jgi:hypothetical protein
LVINKEAMLLKGGDNTEFEMKIVGYQFPHLENEQYDSDWLNVMVRVNLPHGSWSSIDPSLLTWELVGLTEWLEKIADGKRVEPEESFMEPNLRFELTEEEPKKLRVYFELESRPSWAPYDGAGMEDLWAEFDIDADELRKAAGALREDLRRFPIRVRH